MAAQSRGLPLARLLAEESSFPRVQPVLVAACAQCLAVADPCLLGKTTPAAAPWDREPVCRACLHFSLDPVSSLPQVPFPRAHLNKLHTHLRLFPGAPDLWQKDLLEFTELKEELSTGLKRDGKRGCVRSRF